MLNAVKTDLKKNIFSIRFMLGCMAILLLMFSTNCVVDPGEVMPSCSFFMFLFRTDKAFWLTSPLYSDIHMFIRAFQNEWLAVFLPMLTGIVCVQPLCDEISSNNFRINIIRTGMNRYIISKLLSAFITAAAMLLVVCSFFALFCYAAFPSPAVFFKSNNISDYHTLEYYRHLTDFSAYPLNAMFDSNDRLLAGFSKILTAVLYAALPCEVAMFTAALTSNKFVSLSVPVMIYFGIEQFAASAVQKAIEKGNDIPAIWFFDFHSRYYAGEKSFSEILGLHCIWFYLYPIIMILVIGSAFGYILNRRLRI